MFDWLAANWTMLFVFFIVWLLFWITVFVVGGATGRDGLAVISMPMLWLANVPLWMGVVGLVLAIIDRYAGG